MDAPSEWGSPLAVVVDRHLVDDVWRLILGGFRADPRRLMSMAITVVIVTLPSIPSSLPYGYMHTAQAVALRIVGCAIYFALSLWLTVRPRYPRRDSVMQSSISLYRTGFGEVTGVLRQDGSPEPMPIYKRFVPWSAVRAIKQVGGGVYFINEVVGNGHYMTRCAFPDSDSATDFIRTADELRIDARKLTGH